MHFSLIQWFIGGVFIPEGNEEETWSQKVQMGNVLLPQVLEVYIQVQRVHQKVFFVKGTYLLKLKYRHWIFTKTKAFRLSCIPLTS